MAWTNEQLDAINTMIDGTGKIENRQNEKSVIVSAGAGSGKTAVLTERIVKMLESGVDIDSLLVLTFTNAAAGEMKERVRTKIQERPHLHHLLNKVDSAKITTFDAYSLRLVKQYGYLLNIPSDISVIDSYYVYTKTRKVLEEILDEMYDRSSPALYKFFELFKDKDDKKLKNYIMNIYNKVTLEIDTVKFLDEYVDNFYNDDNLDNVVEKYTEVLKREIASYESCVNDIKDLIINEAAMVADMGLKDAVSVDLDDFLDKLMDLKEEDTDFDDIASFFRNNQSIPSYKQTGSRKNDDLKELRKNIGEIKEKINKGLFKKDSKFRRYVGIENSIELKRFMMTNKNLVEFFILVIKELYFRMNEFKREKNAYEFMDIAKLAIKLIKIDEVNKEIKNSLYEILIDEYQDTSDIQETFISIISNNNVYCVGDIKQGIYRFRNANPYIFKKKYEDYKAGNGGYKIDLNKNFRSRSEVLRDINKIFSEVMTLECGDAAYKEDHQMNYGLTPYGNEGENGFSHDLEVLLYPDLSSEELKGSVSDDESEDDDFESKDFEVEAFIIAADIKKRIDRNETRMIEEKYIDEDGNEKKRFVLSPLKYSDFCILIDRTSTFETFKKVLEYKGIPVSINADISLNSDDITALLASLVKLVCLEGKKNYNNDYYHALASIGRSFVSPITDSELFEIIMKSKEVDPNTHIEHFKEPFENEISIKAKEIAKMIDKYSPYDVYTKIISEFKVLEKLPLVGSTVDKMVISEYVSEFIRNVSELGESLYDISLHLDSIISGDTPVKYSLDTKNDPGVKIMTIHKSKGLEFPVCYFPMLHKKFNDSDFKNQVGYYAESGFYFDCFEDQADVLRTLGIASIQDQDVSEKVRLFYVALTRAREKMVIVMQDKESKTHDRGILKSRSFSDILSFAKEKLEPYTTKVDLSSLSITDEYKLDKAVNQMAYSEKPVYDDTSYLTDIISKDRISRETVEILSDKEQTAIDLGLKLHEIMEFMDFKNIDTSKVDKKYKFMIDRIINESPLFKSIKDAETYHELEFIETIDNKEYHGIIDLLAVYDDHIDIIDYKLYNIDHAEYDRQLNIYRKYVKKVSKLPVNCYLLSLALNEYRKVEE